MAKNARLIAKIENELARAEARSRRNGQPERCFEDFKWATTSRRRVVAKAEWTKGEANQRFIVTLLKRRECQGGPLYKNIYCARGYTENRIKECQADLFAGRTSTQTMRGNQLRLWFASMAYLLMCSLRRIALGHTEFADATCCTIQLKLLKVGSIITNSVRRIKIAMASGCPSAQLWRLAAERLAAANVRGLPA